MGDARDGLNVTTVPASGHASHVYQTPEKGGVRWSRVTFDVDRKEIERLVRVLDEHGFLHLAQAYQAKGVDGGAQWVVHVRTRGLDKYVYADNVFPEPLVSVARFVTEQIVDTRPKLRAESRPVRLGRGYGDHLWRAVRRYAVKALEPGLPDFEEAPRVIGLVVPEDPLPQGTRLQLTIVDLTDAGQVLTTSAANSPRFSVFYNEVKVEPWHRYVLELKLLAGTKVVAAGEPVPVITLDGAHAVEVPLTASGQ
jgi:hypothetical protein